MNSSEVIALVAVVTSGLIGLASLGFNFWNGHLERTLRRATTVIELEERYRIALYDKRLEVHQQAYKWLMDLILPLRNVIGAKEDDLSLKDKKDLLRKLANEARSWWDGNCLYLDDKSRSLVVDFIGDCLARANDEAIPELEDELRTHRNALRAVQEGIKMKHLDVPEHKA